MGAITGGFGNVLPLLSATATTVSAIDRNLGTLMSFAGGRNDNLKREQDLALQQLQQRQKLQEAQFGASGVSGVGGSSEAVLLGLAYVIVFETEKSGFVLNSMSSLSAIWAMGLSVLGIYVYKRSEEKKVNTPQKDVIFWNK